MLLENALAPVIAERLAAAKTTEAKERALLALRVCDPASGSGHFLLAAARRIARELAIVRTGESEPTPDEYRRAVREVIRTCIYAVDKNPLAVDLCKVALWIEGYNAGLPLSFLDYHVKCGDSLVGVFDLAVLGEGIPDEAYVAVTGDNRAAASHYKKSNKEERLGQLRLGSGAVEPELPARVTEEFDLLAALDDRTPADVRAKEDMYAALRGESDWYVRKVACDLWTAAFFLPLQFPPTGQGDLVPTTDTVREALAAGRRLSGLNRQLVGAASGYGESHPFFHWALEFADVFRDGTGGFDVVLGNPPWERIKLSEEEFFAGVDPEIAHAPNKAARGALIRALPLKNPGLAAAFAAAKHDAESASRFVRGSGRFPLTGRGDVNTYSIFAETIRNLLGPTGRAGFIVPTGLVTDDTNKFFFQSLVDSESVARIYDFENRKAIFPGVHRSYKFSLITLTGSARPTVGGAELAFFLQDTNDLRDPERRFVLTRADFALLNPNTRTCPIFRTRRDAEITRGIYRRVPVLIKEGPPEVNPWGIKFSAMFHMSNDAGLFRTRPQLEAEGWRLAGNVFEREKEKYLPLYEGKMFGMYDHRAAGVLLVEGNAVRQSQPRYTTVDEYANPEFVAIPLWWVGGDAVIQKFPSIAGRWVVAFKDLTSSTNERTFISTVLPGVGIGNTAPLLISPDQSKRSCGWVANLAAFVFDFASRFKVGGLHLNFFIVEQLPALPPAAYSARARWSLGQTIEDWIGDRVLELTYTAYDLAPFANDLGYDGPPFRWDEERRFLIRCELDAAFFHLYGIERDDVDYIMETFPIVRRKDEAAHGCYRTKQVILEIYDAMRLAMDLGEEYQTRLDPPPGDRRAGHGVG